MHRARTGQRQNVGWLTAWVHALVVLVAMAAKPCAARADPAIAPDQPEPVLVEVDPANGCVTPSEFFERIRRRTPLARVALPGERARRLTLVIDRGDRIVGTLTSGNPDGTTAVREVRGASCADVVDALALVAALALDPFADQRNASTVEGRPPSPRARVAESPRPLPPAPVRREPTEPEAAWQQGLGGEVLLAAGIVDGPLLGLGARYWVSRARPGSAGQLVTLGAFATFDTNAPADGFDGGLVRFGLKAASASVCPLGVRWRAGVRVYPCAAASLGQLEAQGVYLPNGDTDKGLFATVALEGRLMTRIAGPLGLVGSAGVWLPLTWYSVEVGRAEGPAGVSTTGIAGSVGSIGLVLTSP